MTNILRLTVGFLARLHLVTIKSLRPHSLMVRHRTQTVCFVLGSTGFFIQHRSGTGDTQSTRSLQNLNPTLTVFVCRSLARTQPSYPRSVVEGLCIATTWLLAGLSSSWRTTCWPTSFHTTVTLTQQHQSHQPRPPYSDTRPET